MDHSKLVKLNIPVSVDQLEVLSKVVAKVTATRASSSDNERITKASIIRALITCFPFDKLDCSHIHSEGDLLQRVSAFFSQEVQEERVNRYQNERKPVTGTKILLP